MEDIFMKTFKKMSQLFAFIIITCTLFCQFDNIAANASNGQNNNINFEEMTNEELNAFISNIATSTQNSTYSLTLPTPVQQAWLAAAQIAKNQGYQCAGMLVECSVEDIPYTEKSTFGGSDGPIWTKLSTTKAYTDYFKKLSENEKITESSSLVIEKSDNADLFYALHKVDVTAEYEKRQMFGTTFETYTITINDVFDFDYDNDYDDLFTTLVNDWAWLCQQTNVLHPITVEAILYRI